MTLKTGLGVWVENGAVR